MAKKKNNMLLWLGAGAVALFLFKKHSDDQAANAIVPLPYPVDPGNPLNIAPGDNPIINTPVTQAPPVVYPQTGPATFNCVLNEQLEPVWIDGNMQVKANGQMPPLLDLYILGSQTVTMGAGSVYTIEGYAPPQSTSGNIRMSITRNGVLIYDRVVSANGGSLVKQGIAKAGAVYNALVRTGSDIGIINTVDVDDNTISGIGDYYAMVSEPVVIIDGIVY